MEESSQFAELAETVRRRETDPHAVVEDLLAPVQDCLEPTER